MDPIRAMSVPEILVQRILNDIAAGKIQTGDRLPAERDLANQYKISNSSVREAMQTLQGMGIVEVRHPTGTFMVGDPLTSSQATRFSSLINPMQFLEAMEARCMIEMDITRLAAMRATNEQTNELDEIHMSMTLAFRAGNDDLHSDLDLKLHVAIAQSCNNVFLTNYVYTLRVILGSYLKTVKGTEKDLSNHKDLIEAIKSRNILQVEAVTRTMLMHVANNAIDQKLFTRDNYNKISDLLNII